MDLKINNSFQVSIFVVLLITSCNTPELKNSNLENKTLSAKEIYEANLNNTVTITTSKGLGSGFFIDSNIIVTNYHVIEGATTAAVVLNNSDKKQTVLGYLAVDKINDLVLLQINYRNKTFLKIENQIPRPGEKVFAIGSPVGLDKTISEGIISGMRDFESKTLLQITAPISHGSSGCPILNENNRLVGVAVGGLSDAANIGFCIPTNYVNSLLAFRNSYPTSLLTLVPNNTNDQHSNHQSRLEIVNPNKEQTKKVSADEPVKLSSGIYDLRISSIHNSIVTNGKVTIRESNGLFYIQGSQTDEENFRAGSISGRIEVVNDKQFFFSGSIHLKNPKDVSNCADCTINETIRFEWFGYGKRCWSSCAGQGERSDLFGCIFIGLID